MSSRKRSFAVTVDNAAQVANDLGLQPPFIIEDAPDMVFRTTKEQDQDTDKENHDGEEDAVPDLVEDQ